MQITQAEYEAIVALGMALAPQNVDWEFHAQPTKGE